MTEIQVKVSAIEYFNRGRTKHNLGQYATAIADYDTAIQLEPNHVLTGRW